MFEISVRFGSVRFPAAGCWAAVCMYGWMDPMVSTYFFLARLYIFCCFGQKTGEDDTQYEQAGGGVH